MKTVHPVAADAVVHSEDVDSAVDVVEESSVVDVEAVNSAEVVEEVSEEATGADSAEVSEEVAVVVATDPTVNSVEEVAEDHPVAADEVSVATVDVADPAASTSNRTATAEHKRRRPTEAGSTFLAKFQVFFERQLPSKRKRCCYLRTIVITTARIA